MWSPLVWSSSDKFQEVAMRNIYRQRTLHTPHLFLSRNNCPSNELGMLNFQLLYVLQWNLALIKYTLYYGHNTKTLIFLIKFSCPKQRLSHTFSVFSTSKKRTPKSTYKFTSSSYIIGRVLNYFFWCCN